MNSSAIKKTLALVMVLSIIPLTFSSAAAVNNSLTCGVSGTEMFELSDLRSISSDILEYEFNEAKGALAQSACKDLKPDYCGMGACKDGWKCQANVSQCMCFPPN